MASRPGTTSILSTAAVIAVRRRAAPTVATALRREVAGISVDEAPADVCGVLPAAGPISGFHDAFRRLDPVSQKKMTTTSFEERNGWPDGRLCGGDRRHTWS